MVGLRLAPARRPPCCTPPRQTGIPVAVPVAGALAENGTYDTVIKSVEGVFNGDQIFGLPAKPDNKGGALRDWVNGKRFVLRDELYRVDSIDSGDITQTHLIKAFNGPRF